MEMGEGEESFAASYQQSGNPPLLLLGTDGTQEERKDEL
jgi:hypothetical protein